jgi:hypothetical protein
MYIKAFKRFNLSTQQPNTRISKISCWAKRTQIKQALGQMKEGTKKGPLTENKKAAGEKQKESLYKNKNNNTFIIELPQNLFQLKGHFFPLNTFIVSHKWVYT